MTTDPRYGQNAPYFGMPPGHLPVRSYLAVPVKGVYGDVLGGLFFGHSQAGVFTEQHERLAVGIAAWASVALENSRLYVGGAGRQSDEGRVSRRALARAADAAECDRRLRAAAARRHSVRREGRPRPRNPRAERHVADADRRGRARRLPDRLGQDPSGRAARGAAADRGQRRRDGPARRGREGRAPADHRRSARRVRSPAIPIACSRSSGICCPTR